MQRRALRITVYVIKNNLQECNGIYIHKVIVTVFNHSARLNDWHMHKVQRKIHYQNKYNNDSLKKWIEAA